MKGKVRIMFSCNTEKQIKEYLKIISKLEDIKRFDITFSTHSYGNQMNAFVVEEVKNFIEGNEFFIWSYGDLFYEYSLLKKLLSLYEKNRTTVLTLGRPKYRDSILYYLDVNGKVKKVDDESSIMLKKKLGLHMPILVYNFHYDFLFECSKQKRSENYYVCGLIERDELIIGLEYNKIFNVNNKSDFVELENYLRLYK